LLRPLLWLLCVPRRTLALAVVIPIAAALPAVIVACYSIGDGTPPPPSTFYFPVGLAVSQGGTVLYAVNSDFDLQWNGGTIQSYDLYQIRRDAAISAAGYPFASQLPLPEGGGLSEFYDGGTPPKGANPCQQGAYLFLADGGYVNPCAPVINSSFYVRDSVTIGAFATDIQLSPWGNRLYAPVRGDASLTWLTVANDKGLKPPTANQLACDADGGTGDCYAPFTLVCGQAANGGRCDATHHAGVNPFEPGNSRNLTMPGEPFAMAQTFDGTAIVLTHQSEGDTSLFLTGFNADGGLSSPSTPSIQYIADAGLPLGGDGIAGVPHDPAAFGCLPGTLCRGLPLPAFLETNNTTAELNLIRYYSDNGAPVGIEAGVPDANLPVGTSLPRPFITIERTYPLTALSSGTDSRGIAFDTTQRLRCETEHPPPSAEWQQCGEIPSRVFFANRTPDELIIATTGGASQADKVGTYDEDAFSVTGFSAPLDPGPSRVYVAPIIDANGTYQLRVFVVCFDANTVDVVNPDTGIVEANITVGEGPFALTFDPFTTADLAMQATVPQGPAESYTPDAGTPIDISLPTYRFAYVASFTNSYVQVIDLDDSQPNKSTFETVVYTLGSPTVPKGNQ
jgi:YVTN family beta-propeller protein